MLRVEFVPQPWNGRDFGLFIEGQSADDIRTPAQFIDRYGRFLYRSKKDVEAYRVEAIENIWPV